MLTRIVEKALKNAIKYNPNLAEKCRTLGEKDILITLLPMKWEWTIIFSQGEVRCYEKKGMRTPDLQISATPQAFLAMIIRDDKSDLTFEGDMVLAQTLQQCFYYSDTDWEYAFNEILGDSLSYPIRTLFRKSKEKIQEIHYRKKVKMADYLQEDLNCLPFASEVQDFCEAVDDLKLRCDRLEATYFSHAKDLSNEKI